MELPVICFWRIQNNLEIKLEPFYEYFYPSNGFSIRINYTRRIQCLQKRDFEFDVGINYNFFLTKFKNKVPQARINSNPPIGVINPIILKSNEVRLFVASK